MNTSNARSLQTIVFFLIAVGLIALALGGYLAPVSRIFLNPVVEVQSWVTSRYQAVLDVLSAPQDVTRLRQENLELKTENSQLKGQVIELQKQLSETNILSALVDFARANPTSRYQAAAVIGYDPSPFLRYVIINRGSDDGLLRGMPVVTQQGLVGRVAAVNASAARVQLITDSASRVNIRLQPTNTQAVLLGSLTGEVTLDMIPQEVELETGNLIVTSGLGGGFPPDILVGQVTGVRSREQELFQRATVQTAVDFTQLEIVLVIMNFKQVEFQSLVPTPGAP
jgi:rod shape-determining protein MreC